MPQEDQAPPAFTPEAFSTQLTELTDAWKATWVTYGGLAGSKTPGPMFIRNPALLTPEQLAAEQPEMDAYNNLVQQAATGIAGATSGGQGDRAVDCVLELIGREMGSSSHVSDADKQHLLGNIFKQTLAQLSDAGVAE